MMNRLESVARQALEALELSRPARCGQSDKLYAQEQQAHRKAITDLREALAEQQEPTCNTDLQVWVIPRSGQFSWEPQDERFWTRMVPSVKDCLTVHPTQQAAEPVAPAMDSEIALIEKTAKRVGIVSLLNHGAASCVYSEGCAGVTQAHLLAYTREVALHCVAALWQPAPTKQPLTDTQKDAARWQYIRKHWKTITFRFNKRPSTLSGFTLTVSDKVDKSEAITLEREIDDAIAIEAAHGITGPAPIPAAQLEAAQALIDTDVGKQIGGVA